MKNLFKATSALLAASLLFSCSLTVEQETASNRAEASRAADYSFYRAPSSQPPVSIDGSAILPAEAPQFIIFGYDDNQFDDGMTNILNIYKPLKNPAGTGNPLTFDGTPTSASFYVTPGGRNDQWVWTVAPETVVSWKRAYDEGHEIGNHTYYHEHGLAFTTERWSEEIRMCNEFLVDQVGIPREAITGFRTPFLEYNTNLFYALQEHGFEYDNSYEGGNRWDGSVGSTNLWPYTMDNGAPAGENGRPLAPIKGMWQMPTDAVYVRGTTSRIVGFDYNLWFQKSYSKAQFVDILKNSLELKYYGNRAPMNFGMHTNYYSDKYITGMKEWSPNDLLPLRTTVAERTAAVKEFTEWALTLPDVRIVNTQQALEWIKYPVKLTKPYVQHNVTVTASANGKVTPAPGVHKIDDYRDFKVTIDADAGFKIASVTIDGVAQTLPGNKLETVVLTQVTAAKTVDVQFVADPTAVVYTITATSAAEGAFDKEGVTKVEAGETIVYNVTPIAAWAVKTFKVNGSVVANPVFPYTINNVSSDMTLAVDFDYVGEPYIFTYYWKFDYKNETDIDLNTPPVELLNLQNEVIEVVPEALARRLSMEGSGYTPGGKLINLANSFDWPNSRFFECEKQLAPYGYDAQGGPLKPWVSAAVDPNYIPINSDIYMKEFDGVKLPEGGIHDGWMKAVDTSHSFTGKWVDVFSASYQNYQYMTNLLSNITSATVKFNAGNVFTVTLDTDTNGFLTGSLAGDNIPHTSAEVAQGMDRVFIPVPNAGYEIDMVTVNGVAVQPTIPAKNMYNLVNIQENIVLRATFKPKGQVNLYTVTATAGANGAVTPGTLTVESGQKAVFTVAPAAGYVVDAATLDGTAVAVVNNTITVTPVKDSALHVTFKVKPAIPEYTVTATAGANGTVTPASATVQEGANVTFTITPAAGYTVDTATLNGAAVTVTGNSFTVANVTANAAFAVTFKLVPVSGLTATYKIDQDWGTGFGASVVVKNTGSTTVNSWTVTMTFAGNQKISGWNAIYSQTGNVATVTNTNWNGTIAPGATVSFGFNGSYTGTNDIPTIEVK